MPSSVNNYPNSFYKMYGCEVDKCIRYYDGCQPIPDVIPNMGMEIIEEIIPGFGLQFLVVPMACDIWDCGVLNALSPDYSYFVEFTLKLANIYRGEHWLRDFVLTNSADNYYNTENSNSVTTFFTNIGYTTMPKCFCWMVVELKRDGVNEEFSAIIAKSEALCLVDDSECDVVKISYSNNDMSLGFPSIAPLSYELYFWGKFWKPKIKNESKVYLKSNGEWRNEKDRFDEIYTLEGRLTEYHYIKAINVALKSKTCIIENKVLDQFAGGATQLSGYLDEDMDIQYVNGCYSSARFIANILNKYPNGSISYNC